MTKKRKLQPLEGSPKPGRITTITHAIDSEPQPIRCCSGGIEIGLEIEDPWRDQAMWAYQRFSEFRTGTGKPGIGGLI